jgi:hypothetical protein
MPGSVKHPRKMGGRREEMILDAPSRILKHDFYDAQDQYEASIKCNDDGTPGASSGSKHLPLKERQIFT